MPNLDNSRAISYPCFPLDSLEINLTGSIYSFVGFVVTIALIFFFLSNFFLKNLSKKIKFVLD